MMTLENVQTLEDGIMLLKEDHTNGARVLATHALKTLQTVLQNFRDDAATADILWQDLRVAGYKLTLARPSMSAATTSAIVEALSAIRMTLDRPAEQKVPVVKEIAKHVIDQQIQARQQSSEQVAQAFVDYLRSHPATKLGRVHILTLSSSSTLAVCLRTAVRALTNLTFTILILESRPAMEGATFGVNFLNDLHDAGNVKVEIAPDSHVCMFASRTDILLLGADRVSGQGDVSNKMGSLAAAVAIKSLSTADVVVAAESDKIASHHSTVEHNGEENDDLEVSMLWPQETRDIAHTLDGGKLRVRNVYFEEIPSRFVDVYLSQHGVLDTKAIGKLSKEKQQLEDAFFDSTIVSNIKTEA
jgi:translation initiation factor 2B subunit (eIF-2B alpha/beta/delta family)